ncbi:MAG: hypothetical protein LBC74_14810 [Planctomycetaceae bacterium]|jgi:hypothetical protein|nr:hypothetical protein [Planctomycetaceae bacterium]
MAELNVSLLDVLKFKGLDGREIINEVIKSNPAVTGNDTMGHSIPVASDTISWDSFKGLYRISNEEVDPFRAINSGAGMSQGAYETRRFDITTVTRYFWVDRALMKRDADAWSKFLTAQCANGIESVISALEKQFFYGGQVANSTPSKYGFQELQEFIEKDMVFDAGGSGANLSSAYLVNFNNRNGVTWLFGENGTMEFGDSIDDDVPDPKDPTKLIPVVRTNFEFYPGFGFLSRYAASRIANIDITTAFTVTKNRTAFTDEMITTAIAKWPYGTPNAIITTKAAGIMLAASRTVTSIVGAGSQGADITVQSGYTTLPHEHNGIPIAYSDVLINKEKRVIGIPA